VIYCKDRHLYSFSAASVSHFFKLPWGEQRWGRSKWGAAWQQRLQEWKGLESSGNLSLGWSELNDSMTHHLCWNLTFGLVSEIHRNPMPRNPLIHAGLCLHLGYCSCTDTYRQAHIFSLYTNLTTYMICSLQPADSFVGLVLMCSLSF